MSEQSVFDMYEILLNSEDGKKTCGTCRAECQKLDGPISIWQVGSEFCNSKYKVMFVGKTARGTPGDFTMSGISVLDARDRGDELYLDPVKKGAYWSYTKEICNKVEGENSWEKIAFSNIVKCNNSNANDTATQEMKEHCIIENRIILKEIEIVDPDTIIFYTGCDYDQYIVKMFADSFIKDGDKTERQIGAKLVPWWEFVVRQNGHDVHCLRTGHPERKKKTDFVNGVAAFIMFV